MNPTPLNPEFLGGPPELFERSGREQLMVLLENGLMFESTVLDIGCGVLRGGRWIIPLLRQGNYCGVEPQRHLVDRGLREFVDPGILELKRPRFDFNNRFDFSVFGVSFTHFLARSIWTHASKRQIEQMLDGMVRYGSRDAVMLTSYRSASFVRGRPDYRGDAWRGVSHESESPGMVAHSFRWIQRECGKRGLTVERVDRRPLAGQVWLRVASGAR
jgi:SAM-dependent methyltransferase